MDQYLETPSSNKFDLPSILQPAEGRHATVEQRIQTIKNFGLEVAEKNNIDINADLKGDNHHWYNVLESWKVLAHSQRVLQQLEPDAKLANESLHETAMVGALQLSEKITLEQKNRATDPLTGAWSRASLDNRIQLIQERMKVDGQRLKSVGLLFIDIDKFKDFNDTFSHAIGDEVLKKLVNKMEVASRVISDLVARYGGEEFGILIVSDVEDFLTLVDRAEAIRSDICEDFSITAKNTKTNKEETRDITISMSIIRINNPDESLDQIYERASIELHSAKNGGRNQSSYNGQKVGKSTNPTKPSSTPSPPPGPTTPPLS